MVKTVHPVQMVDLVFLVDLENEVSPVLKVKLVNLVHLVSKALQEDPVSAVRKEKKGRLKFMSSRARKVCLVYRVNKVIQVRTVVQDMMVYPENRVQWVIKANKVTLVNQVILAIEAFPVSAANQVYLAKMV